MLGEYEHRALDQAAPLRPLPQPHYKGVDHCAHFILALEVRPEFAFRCGAGGSYRKPDRCCDLLLERLLRPVTCTVR